MSHQGPSNPARPGEETSTARLDNEYSDVQEAQEGVVLQAGSHGIRFLKGGQAVSGGAGAAAGVEERIEGEEEEGSICHTPEDSVNVYHSPEEDAKMYHMPDDDDDNTPSPSGNNANTTKDKAVGDAYALPQKKKINKTPAATQKNSTDQAPDSLYNVLNFSSAWPGVGVGKSVRGREGAAEGESKSRGESEETCTGGGRGAGGGGGDESAGGLGGGEESSVYSRLQNESEDLYNQVNRHNARRADVVVGDEYSRIKN
jgi:hypothetical protein